MCFARQLQQFIHDSQIERELHRESVVVLQNWYNVSAFASCSVALNLMHGERALSLMPLKSNNIASVFTYLMQWKIQRRLDGRQGSAAPVS